MQIPLYGAKQTLITGSAGGARGWAVGSGQANLFARRGYFLLCPQLKYLTLGSTPMVSRDGGMLILGPGKFTCAKDTLIFFDHMDNHLALCKSGLSGGIDKIMVWLS